jgi:pimeloyl-ACP methyl ester carboxylesterase
VRKLVVISAAFRADGWYPEVRAGMTAITAEVAATWVGSPMHESYVQAAPRPDDWTRLAGKMGDLLRQDYDWSQQIPTIQAPTLIAAGDADGVSPAHAAELFALLGGKAGGVMGDMPVPQLAVLPATSHYTILFRLDLLAPIMTAFLDAPPPEAG